MSKEDYIMALFKFGKKEHLELLQKGELFCRPLSYFQKSEETDSAKRHDTFEGCSHLIQSDVLKSNGIDIVIGYGDFDGETYENIVDLSPYIVGPIRRHDGIDNKATIYCLFALRLSHINQYLNGQAEDLVGQNLEHFGGYVLFIHNPQQFIERMENAARQEGLSSERGLIEYVNTHKHHGKYGIFKKPEEYKNQSEYRIALSKLIDHTDDTFTLRIGNISDISTLMSFLEFKKCKFFRTFEDDPEHMIEINLFHPHHE